MRQFSMLIKPASSLCNMRCRYCFYHDVASHREAYSHGVMKERTAQAVIDRAFEHVGAGPAEITFGFQGGEPAVAGLDFFRAFTAYVREKQPAGVRVRYALQTNGTLLTDEWAAFLSEHDFLVGVSLDGSREVHDFLRLDKDGRGTYAAVTRGIRRLDAHGAAYNILAVVTRQMARHPRQVYAALTRAGYRYLQFIPCLRPLEGGDRQPFDLTPRGLCGVSQTDLCFVEGGLGTGTAGQRAAVRQSGGNAARGSAGAVRAAGPLRHADGGGGGRERVSLRFLCAGRISLRQRPYRQLRRHGGERAGAGVSVRAHAAPSPVRRLQGLPPLRRGLRRTPGVFRRGGRVLPLSGFSVRVRGRFGGPGRRL